MDSSSTRYGDTHSDLHIESFYFVVTVYFLNSGIGLSEREARILARLNARKNRKPSQPKHELQSNGNHATSMGNNNKTEISENRVETNSLADNAPEENQISNGKVKKKKRKTMTESDCAMECESAPADTLKKKKESEMNGETVSGLAINENEVDVSKSKNKKKKPKLLSGENDANSTVNQGQSPKKKKKKNVPELETDQIPPTNNKEDEDLVENSELIQKEEEPAGTGFTILEEFKANKNQKVFRVLPTWLAKPSVISCDLSKNKMPIKELNGLDKFILDALRRNKIAHFFPGTLIFFYQMLSSK